MVCVWGTRLFGKVDEVPGLGYVSTEFLHLWYLPLYPLQSHLVFEESFTSWHSLPMELHRRSLLTAWLRATLVVSMACLAIFSVFLWPSYGNALPFVGDLASGRGFLLIVAGVLGLGLAVTKIPAKQLASYEQAVENARRANAPEGVFDLLKLIYNRVKTKPEMAEIMARLNSTGLLASEARILSDLDEYDAENELLPDQSAPASQDIPFG